MQPDNLRSSFTVITTASTDNAFLFHRQRTFFIATCLLIAGLMTTFHGFASDSTSHYLKKNILFASFGGKENLGSINYERVFSTGQKLHWSFAIGVQPFQPSKKLSVPLSVNAFTKGRLHHLEVDISAVFYMDKYHPYDGGWKDDFNKQLYITPYICYRLQGTGKLMLKAGVGPQWRLDPPSNDVTAFRTEFGAGGFAAIGYAF